MKKLCVIGDPVLHSKSPLIQNTMIRALGLDYEYLCQPVTREELPAWLERVRAEGWAGFNATMPHKEALVPYMDELDEDAKLYGAVNTVCHQNGKLYGFNTDGGGFARALAGAGIPIKGTRFVLLGAGGAAKAVTLKLVQQGAGQVVICNRTVEKAAALAAHAPDIMSTSGFSAGELARAAADCDVLINCTNLGMAGSPEFESLDFLDALPADARVCDLIYHPLETALLARARALGRPAMNGLPLLIHQAILALEHFTETKIDAAAMLPLVEEALAQAL
ncbi:MAG: shikimate dehydrogenase [Oscillospiraceae bacterium]